MIKVYVPPIEKFELNEDYGEINHVLKDGLRKNSKTELVKSYEECDYVFADFRHLIPERTGYTGDLRTFDSNKLIVIDYSDRAELYDIDCLHYFKRSSVNKGQGRFREYPKKIHHISYCIKNKWLDFNVKKNKKRDIDISVFFRERGQRVKGGMYNREVVASFVKQTFSDKNIWVGIANKDGEEGRINMGSDYVDKMLNSKIVVNCNPDHWEGDYRLFESLSCGPLVLVDHMITPVKNPFENNKHLGYYGSLEELRAMINDYLHFEETRKEVAYNGYKYSLEHHTTSNRIDEILEVIEDGKKQTKQKKTTG